MAENKIISNIDYNIKNRSNYDIVKEETRDIIDVPYFPAQNLVEVIDEINLFSPQSDIIIPFYDENNSERFVSCLINRKDARFLFINIFENKRYLNYRFVGTHYPQGREHYSISYNGKDRLVIGFGKAGGRPLQDIWLYKLESNEWELVNYTSVEKSANEMPTRRYDASILLMPDEILIFGGKTDAFLTGENVETSNYTIPLNDIWSFKLSSKTFENYDPNRILPRRIGNIIYADANIIKVLIAEGTDALGNYQPNRIWIINRTTNEVTYVDYDPPFVISRFNISLYINSKFYILSNGKLYEFDNNNNQFNYIKDLNGIWYDEYYFLTEFIQKHRGDNTLMKEDTVLNINIKTPTDITDAVYSINLPPFGTNINKCYYDGGIFYYSGFITPGEFDENTYIFDRETYFTEKLTFPEDQRPTERIYTSMCYDRYRNVIWLFGGYDGTKFYNDLWYFDLVTKTWHKVHDCLENIDEDNPTYPPPRQKAGICVVANGEYLYIIGGFSDIKVYDDFWKYHIPTGKWEREWTVDGIPWGTEYFIFEYKDRLWMFNGDPSKIYRYYYNKKMFIPQKLLYSFINEDAKRVIESREFLDPPIFLTVIDNYLFIYNNKVNWRINLEDRVILDLKRDFNFNSNILWVNFFTGFNESSLYSYYINYSELQPLTKNQLPLCAYYYGLGKFGSPVRYGFYSTYPTDTDTKLVYIDKSGLFTIQREKDYLDKFELLDNGTIYPALQPSKHIGDPLDDPSYLTSFLLDRIRKPWFVPQRPWFLYNKFSDMFNDLKGAVYMFKDPSTTHVTYTIYDSGSICRINHKDLTFYVYDTKLPFGSAIFFDKNNKYIYSFGGIPNDRPVYNQYGIREDNPDEKIRSTSALLKIDLNMYDFNIHKISDYLKRHNISRIDYEVIKNYIIDEIKDYLNYYAHPNENIHPDVLAYIQQKIYFDTKTLLDDLSQIDVTHENGVRPDGRAFMQFWQDENSLYIFGGAKITNGDCINSDMFIPFRAIQPDNPKTIFKFDVDKQQWNIIGEFPTWLYYSSTILTPDGKDLIIVGGYTGEDWEGLTNDIWIYHLGSNTFEKFKGISDNFQARAMPLLHWIDEHRLLIQYGFWSFKQIKQCDLGSKQEVRIIFMPVMDAWILDLKNEVMYQVWEDYLPFGITVYDYYSDENKRERKTYLLNPYPMIKGQTSPQKASFDSTIKLLEINNVNGETKVINILPSSDILTDYSPFTKYANKELSDNNGIANPNIEELEDILFEGDSSSVNMMSSFLFGKVINSTNYIFRHAWIENIDNNRILFIVGEKCMDSGIEFIRRMRNKEKESHFRIWYCNLDEDPKVMNLLKVDYPIPYSPKTLCYDGKQYIYVYWNKYNIWRFNFKGIIEGKTTQPWYRLPPNPTLGELDNNISLTSKIINNKYLLIYDNIQGKIFKMDIDTFTWFADRVAEIRNPINNVNLGKEIIVFDDDNTLYKLWIGQISGKYYDIMFKQCDNFFFDMRYLDKTISNYDELVFDMGLWGVYIKRNRLYIFNHLGHLMYSWIKIYGQFDLEYQLHEFYKVDHIRIYTDSYGLSQKDRFNVEVFTLNNGWVSIPNTDYITVIEDNDYIWDSEYTRRYKKEIILPSGDITYSYTKCPPNYIKIHLTGADPISKIRVRYIPKPEEFDYIVRINKVEAIDTENEINVYEDGTYTTPISIVRLTPITTDEDETPIYVVWIRNDSSYSLSKIKTYLPDNNTKRKWLAFSLDTTTWKLASPSDPLIITDSLSPGESAYFYIKGINIDDNPKVGDLVIIGYQPL